MGMAVSSIYLSGLHQPVSLHVLFIFSWVYGHADAGRPKGAKVLSGSRRAWRQEQWRSQKSGVVACQWRET